MNPNDESHGLEGPPAAIETDGQPAEPVPRLIDFQTRFLYPFFFEPNAVKRASDALATSAPAGRAGAWECAAPLEFYKEEVLDQVIKFLFTTGGQAGCGYLRISGTKTQTWFHETRVTLPSGVTLPVNLVAGPRIEVFLSNDGVGVLSVALTPERPGLALQEALEYNYRLAQCRPKTMPEIEVPGPDLSKVPPAHRDKVQPPPAPDAPLAERLTQRGGKFTLVELIEALLAPLKIDPAFRFRAAQPMLSVFTVALFDDKADFGRADVRDRLAPFLSSLAQIEEPSHPGATTVSIANALLNRRHWAAVGQLGAAHLIANQPPPQGLKDHPFNTSRLPRIRDKYFIPYLMALLQRLVLHRSVETASTILKAQPRQRSRELARLRENLLRFAVDGHYNQISTREVLHRFYRVAQQGLDAPTAWEEIRLAIAELHAWEAEARQRRMVKKVSLNVRHIREVQEFVHLIEYFLASVYLAHLWHMFAEGNKEHVEAWVGRTLHIQPEWVVSAGVVVFAVAGLLLVVVLNGLLKWHERWREAHEKLRKARARERVR